MYTIQLLSILNDNSSILALLKHVKTKVNVYVQHYVVFTWVVRLVLTVWWVRDRQVIAMVTVIGIFTIISMTARYRPRAGMCGSFRANFTLAP